MNKKYIGIRYPFQESNNGFFIDLTQTDEDAIKSNLMHLLFTVKGRRLYHPDFGTNLLKYIYEPLDEKTITDIIIEMNLIVSRYLPNIVIKNIYTEEVDGDNYKIKLTVEYEINDDYYKSNDNLIVYL